MHKTFTSLALATLASVGLALTPVPAAAQMREIDPNNMRIDSDLDNPPPPPTAGDPVSSESYDSDLATGDEQTSEVVDPPAAAGTNSDATAATVAADTDSTYKKDDLIGAAEGVFGKGAQGLAAMIEDGFGEP